MEAEVEAKAKLAKKLCEILGEVGEITKSGENTYQGYQYTTESDLLEAIKPKLVEKGIFIFSSVDSQERIGDLTLVKTSHTFIDSETGAEHTVHCQGQGSDKQDKGVYKAITGANKYFLWKNFLIETGDDPEKDEVNPSYVKNKDKTATGGKKSFSRPSKETITDEPEPEKETKKEEKKPVKTYRKRNAKETKTAANKKTTTKSTTKRTFGKSSNKQFLGHAGTEPKF